MNRAVQRFACTQCGKCCNRSPEVLLSEAAALADIFVFRLMFRLYSLPHQVNDYITLDERANTSAIFFEKKRLLGAFAARRYRTKMWRDEKLVQYTKYLMISALAVDTRPGACSALSGKRCGIYDRRPLSCRTVPFHYSRAQGLMEAGLKAFVETPGYECDTSETAEIITADGQIVAPEIKAARSAAIALTEGDRRWNEAIVRRMNASSSATHYLPNLQEIETSAHLGVMTTSMRVAWRIAADVRLIAPDECDRIAESQLYAIDRELGAGKCSQDAREMLSEMRAEYRQQPNRGHAIAVNA